MPTTDKHGRQLKIGDQVVLYARVVALGLGDNADDVFNCSIESIEKFNGRTLKGICNTSQIELAQTDKHPTPPATDAAGNGVRNPQDAR